ncbi:MAG TPA: tRNA (N6-isopentenyl adenosine(37)-C2)-methylthiotransferase MiaB [Candidatus Ruthenibacterium merdigallinarum]|nr:tRNA (N6-isopentenyl adenosine(37)-C2)-methylthiotransferase MiaB [Candidatus Ruthenibacterium merdigallinarum]
MTQAVHFTKNAEAAAAIMAYYNEAPPRAYVHSFGCQQNVNDGEKILGVLLDAGYGEAASPEEADLIIFNTCAVREHAEQRVFGNVGALKQLKEQNPRLMIAVCGCMAQQPQVVEKFKMSYPFVDLVFGVNGIDRLPQLIAQRITGHKRVMQQPFERTEIVEDMPIRRGSSFRAWLPIMYGCDNFCSYCIVPYVRGRERSRKSADILAEFRQLVAQGYKDITLLGQNVNSYGKGLDEGLDFADLLAMLDAEPGDYRIRFMTSHPKDATKKLIDTMAAGRHIAHHLHLPVQSGSDRILQQMNRHYTAQSYLALIDYAKSRIPDMTYSSDIIVGFPGETPEDFEETLRLIERVEYMQLFTFIYSKRTGTRAAEMPDNTPHEEKAARIARIVEVQDAIVEKLTGQLAGTTARVLVEGPGRLPGVTTGRLDNNMVVEFAQSAPAGQFAEVTITGAKGAVLKGELRAQ